MRREARKRVQGERGVSGYAIRTPLAYIDEESGRQMPFLVCAEEQNGGGWWVEEEAIASGTAECPRVDIEDRTLIPHPRHRVVSFEEALWQGIVDAKEGCPGFGWDQVLEQMRSSRRTAAASSIFQRRTAAEESQ